MAPFCSLEMHRYDNCDTDLSGLLSHGSINGYEEPSCLLRSHRAMIIEQTCCFTDAQILNPTLFLTISKNLSLSRMCFPLHDYCKKTTLEITRQKMDFHGPLFLEVYDRDFLKQNL